MLTILRGIWVFISICLIFSGIFLISSKPLFAIALFAVGGLLMAIAYDAFKKPVFFILPIATISFGILFRSLDSKGISPVLGILIGIAISTRFAKSYYQSANSEFDQEKSKK